MKTMLTAYRKFIYAPVVAALLCCLFLSSCAKKKQSSIGHLKISSEPAGATIIIDGKNFGKTPGQLRMPPGNKLIKLELSGYRPQWQMAQVKAREFTNLDFKLHACRTKVLITSTPENVEIFFDGQLKGSTPLLIQDLNLGNHALVAKKTGFSPRQIPFTLKDFRPMKIVVSLISNIGNVAISSNPPGAQISINGKNMGSTPQEMPLAEGSYHITVSENGYVSEQRTVLIKRGELIKVNCKLRLKPGSIVVKSTPEHAMIYLNGEYKGRTPLELTKLQPGTYKIKLTREGFDSYEEHVIVYAGKKSQCEGDLENNSGSLEVVVVPPGSSVYVDGKLVGQSVPDEKDKNYSKIMHLNGISAGTHTITVAHKRAKPHIKNIKVTVKKGETTRLKPIHLWVENAILKLKNAGPQSGHLYSIIKDRVMFSPDPGVKIQYRMSEIEYIKKLKEKDE